MDNFNIHEWNLSRYLNENKGAEMATKLISKIRTEIFPKLDDKELDTFKKYLADAFDMEVKEEEKPEKEKLNTQDPSFPKEFYLSYIDGGAGNLYSLVYLDNSGKSKKISGYEAANQWIKDTFGGDDGTWNDLPNKNDEVRIQAVVDQIQNATNGYTTYKGSYPMDVS